MRYPNKTVYFDKSCPLCSAEISHYQRLAQGKSIDFIDVSCPRADLGDGVSRADAMARFHVRDETGALHSGGAAFSELWASLPWWRHVASLTRLPGARWVLERLYTRFLPARPTLAYAMSRVAARKAARRPTDPH